MRREIKGESQRGGPLLTRASRFGLHFSLAARLTVLVRVVFRKVMGVESDSGWPD